MNRWLFFPCVAATARLTAVATLLVLASPGKICAASDPVRVSIGSDTGMPGESVIIPLTLGGGGDDVASIKAEVEFSGEDVRFEEAHVSIGLENAGGRVEAYSDTSGAGKALVRLVIQAPRPLPDGTIASLQWRIGEKAASNRDLALHIKSVIAATRDGKTIAPVTLEDGTLTISAAPPTLVNCFFFSH